MISNDLNSFRGWLPIPPKSPTSGLDAETSAQGMGQMQEKHHKPVQWRARPVLPFGNTPASSVADFHVSNLLHKEHRFG